MAHMVTWKELQERKRKSREADAKALADGTKTREQLRRENTFLPAQPNQKIDWSRIKSPR